VSTAKRLDDEKMKISSQRDELMDERKRWEQALLNASQLNEELVRRIDS
jgi:hypothetical protein